MQVGNYKRHMLYHLQHEAALHGLTPNFSRHNKLCIRTDFYRFRIHSGHLLRNGNCLKQLTLGAHWSSNLTLGPQSEGLRSNKREHLQADTRSTYVRRDAVLADYPS